MNVEKRIERIEKALSDLCMHTTGMSMKWGGESPSSVLLAEERSGSDSKRLRDHASDSPLPDPAEAMNGPEQTAAWDAWKSSHEGLCCLGSSSLTGENADQYLENRLGAAFLAGIVAAERHAAAAQSEVEAAQANCALCDQHYYEGVESECHRKDCEFKERNLPKRAERSESGNAQAESSA